MPNFNPFSNDSEDTSFERGAPVSQAAKSVTKAVSNQATTNAKAIGNTLLDWLYGTDSANADPQGDDAAKQAVAQGQQISPQQAANASSSANSTKSPEEQAELAKVRQELFAKNYGGRFGVEPEMEKARQERKQKEQQKKQEEEEEKQRQEAAKAQMSELPMPRGKSTGRMRMSKPSTEQPIELERAKTATEANRGTTG